MNALKLGHVEAAGGPVDIIADAPTLRGWDPVNGTWTLVTMQARYSPRAVRGLPNRQPLNAGETVVLPAPEAIALITVGYAVTASGAPVQHGTGTN